MTSMINGVILPPGVPAPAPTTGPAANKVAAIGSDPTALNPQAFLQLLVAQLQYQDPTNPVDTSSFMQQTATLSQVQTMNTMASSLTALVSAQQAQSATTMIGKTVTYVDQTGVRVSGLVSAANLTATGATLTVGTATVPLSSVVEVTASTSGTTTP